MLNYWFTANLFSLSQYLLINKIPGMKRRLKIPETVQHAPKPAQQGPNPLFWDSVRSQYEAGLKQAEEDAARARADRLKNLPKK